MTRGALQVIRRVQRRELREKWDGVDIESSDADFDAALPLGGMTAPRRITSRLPQLPEAERAILDDLLERQGLAKVLRTLRELADSRAFADDWEAPVTALDECEVWRVAAESLEQLTLKVAT